MNEQKSITPHNPLDAAVINGGEGGGVKGYHLHTALVDISCDMILKCYEETYSDILLEGHTVKNQCILQMS